MSLTTPDPRSVNHLALLLRGESLPWTTFGVTPAEFLEACAEQELVGLVHQRLCDGADHGDWPLEVHEGLARERRAQSARELLRREEIVLALDALAADGIAPILLKGTPLAYNVYPAPASRPRSDTDLLIRREQVDAARRVMIRLGYVTPVYCNGELLFRQFEMRRRDRFDVDHVFDFHWKISTQALFADVLTYDELAGEAVPVPELGWSARGAGALHALLLACIHPVMHHRNIDRLIWIYDIHLLASRLSGAALDRFVDLAVAKQVARVSAHSLALARSRFGTGIPHQITARLAERPGEPSAIYLRAARRWHNDLVANLRALPRWTHRVRLLREVLLPDPTYMLRAYGLTRAPLAGLLLPVLYFYRGVRGGIRVLAGRK